MNYGKEDIVVMQMPEWKRKKFLQDAGELEVISSESQDQALKNVLLSRAQSLRRVAFSQNNR